MATHIDAQKPGQAVQDDEIKNLFYINKSSVIADMTIVVSGLEAGATITFPTIENRIGYELATTGYGASTLEPTVTRIKNAKDTLKFEVKIDSDYAKTKDFAVKAGSTVLKPDAKGYYSVNFGADATITITGLVKRNSYEVTFEKPSIVSIYETADEREEVGTSGSVAYSDEDFIFHLKVKENAIGAPEVSYKVDTKEAVTITPDKTGNYRIPKAAFEGVAAGKVVAVKVTGVEAG